MKKVNDWIPFAQKVLAIYLFIGYVASGSIYAMGGDEAGPSVARKTPSQLELLNRQRGNSFDAPTKGGFAGENTALAVLKSAAKREEQVSPGTVRRTVGKLARQESKREITPEQRDAELAQLRSTQDAPRPQSALRKVRFTPSKEQRLGDLSTSDSDTDGEIEYL